VVVYVGPDFQQVPIEALIARSDLVGDMEARLAALEGAMAPANIAAPYVSQAGDVLNCTMGEWTGTPETYSYQWQVDGSDVGSDAATYTVVAADVGKTAVCIVTATNAKGSTTAPPSNEIVIAGAAP
jgi:hypothetical protein